MSSRTTLAVAKRTAQPPERMAPSPTNLTLRMLSLSFAVLCSGLILSPQYVPLSGSKYRAPRTRIGNFPENANLQSSLAKVLRDPQSFISLLEEVGHIREQHRIVRACQAILQQVLDCQVQSLGHVLVRPHWPRDECLCVVQKYACGLATLVAYD